jgi:hypothetical protein
VRYEENQLNPLDEIAYEEARRIVEAIPVSSWYGKAMATHLFPYNAKFAGKAVQVLPLPECLFYFMDGSAFGQSESHEKTLDVLHRRKSRYSFFAAIRNAYDAWCVDFWRRVTMSSTLWNMWALFFPDGTRPLDIKPEALPSRENMLTSRDVFCSDGVSTDKVISPADEAYATLSNGYIRKRMFLNRELQAGKAAAELDAPELWVVPPITSLTMLPIRSTYSPLVMSSMKPPNVFTQFTPNLYTDEWFLNLSGGVSAALYPNLSVATPSGPRPPQDDDTLYASGFFLARGTGYSYIKPDFDIGSFYVVNSDGYAVVAARQYMQMAFLSGVYPNLQKEYVLDDLEKQQKLAQVWHTFERSSPAELHDMAVLWRTVRWIQSSGAIHLKQFQTQRETI